MKCMCEKKAYLKDKAPQINIHGRQHFTRSGYKIKKTSGNW